ncbi:enoyl-CoA hydratase-related protein, partial [Escherichia coli]|uniref:enoyl-CoA hydratase-related protein n=1 Tax=Escherichia coli TaxID=562 RepID=UPI0020336251
RRLRMYNKPTIAMVNGWCFGGGFSPLVACDLAIAADDTTATLHDRLAADGARLIVDALVQLERDGTLPATPQPADG